MSNQVKAMEHETTFKNTKYMLSLMILRSPIRTEYSQAVPNPDTLLEDTMIMALMIFMQIVYNIHQQTIFEWDHSTLASRIALAISAGIAVKFCMDEQPFSTSFFMSLILKHGEILIGEDELKSYVCGYEKEVVVRINVYRCFLNHRCWAAAFLDELLRQHEISEYTAKRVYEILVFVSFNICEFLPEFGDEQEEDIAEAMVVISIQCTQNSSIGMSLTKSTSLCPSHSYDLAKRIAHSLANKSTEDTQSLLGGHFVNRKTWQYRATTPAAVRRVAFDMDRKKMLCGSSTDR